MWKERGEVVLLSGVTFEQVKAGFLHQVNIGILSFEEYKAEVLKYFRSFFLPTY